MTDKEIFREEIERRLAQKEFGYEDGGAEHGYKECLLDLKGFVDSMQDKPVSKDLEEAAVDYCGGNKGSDARVRTAYIMGANWKTDRLLKDAVCATIDYPIIGSDFPNIYPNYRELKDYCDKHNIKDDDKVKIIIVKEE